MTKTMRGGAGRKRVGGGKRPYLLSVRVDDRTRDALERAADRRQWTISAEVARRLEKGIADEVALEQVFGASENRGFTALIVQFARRLTLMTDTSWRNSAYVYREFEAGLLLALQVLPQILGLEQQPVVPDRVRQRFPGSPEAPLDDASLPSPGELGRRLMLGVLDQLLLIPAAPEADPDNPILFAHHYFEFPHISRDLGLARNRSAS